jgi:hypothetical protein
MKLSDLIAMKAGDDVKHKRYGLCQLREIHYSCGHLFGVIVRPRTEEGKTRLAADSGTTIPDMMEDSLRQLQAV